MKTAPLVLITTSFPIELDGSEAAGSFVADLVVELAERTSVRVVAPGKYTTTEPWSRHVDVYRYSAPTFPLSILKPWRPGDLIWTARVLREGAAAARAAANGASHLFALWGLPCGEWARRAARANGIGYSTWLLGSDVWSLGRVPVLRGMLARVIRQASHAYADGYRLAEDAQRIAGAPVAFLPSTRKVGVLKVSPPRKQPPYRILFLGRWHRNKGVDLLLDALLQLNDDDWRNLDRVDIQGGGPLEPLVREHVAALQAAGRPVQAGQFLAKPAAEAAIAGADWLVIPSRIESIPVVFSDAMKMGRPVITTPVGDMPRLVNTNPACGVLANAVNADALATALRSAITGESMLYSAGVRKQALDFALPAIAQRLLLEFGHD